MINDYKIKSINNEEVLFIFLDYTYEFGTLGGTSKKKNSILDEVSKTLKKAGFSGKKVVLMVGTIAIATLLYTGTGFKGNIISEHNSDYLSSRILEKNDIFNNFDIKDISIENSITEAEEIVKENQSINIIDAKEEQSTTNNNIKTEQKKTSSNSTTSQEQQSTPSTNNFSNKNEPVVQPADQPVEKPIELPSQESSPIKQNEVVVQTIVTVYRSNGTVLQIELEEYLVGVVAAEMPASFSIEALKAQAIVARTYTLKRMSGGLILTDTVSTQEYKDISQMKSTWQGDFQKYYDKIKSAVDSTKGKYITYNGNYIDAVYHSTSNGYTEDSVYVWGNNIPYLKSVDSNWDKFASSYSRTETKDYNTILNILGISINADIPVEILSRNSSGRITSFKIGDSTYTGINLRNLLGLRSTDFDIAVQNGNLVFTTRGYGHGVGMSQYGANGMANSGYKFAQILTHYYQNVQIVG